jgi:hypothetical protein
MNTKYLLALGLPLVVLAGCGQQSNTTTQPSAQSDAPAGSSAQEASTKTGDHHADAAGESKAHTHSTKLDFSSTPGALPVGKAATWTLKITDQNSGQPVKDYEIVHDKLMHLIVVKNDLSWFNHIHPEHKGDGTFEVSATLPTAGSYKLYADYTPKGGEQEIATHEFGTSGAQSTATPVLLVNDKMQGPWMTKKVVAHPEGEPDAKGGTTYEVALMPMPMPIRAGQDTMMHFQIRDAKGQPLKDLQPYLGAMGHCVILSSDTESYLHSHPMEGGADHDMSKMGDMKNMKHAAPPKSGGPDVMFHTNFPSAGQYKVWGQFMHKGKIITASFVVTAGEARPGAAKAGDGHDHAPGEESKPHAH